MIDAEALKTARKAADLSQDDLAKMSGTSPQLIGQLERREVLTIKHVYAIAVVLKMPVRELDPDIPTEQQMVVPIVGTVGAGAVASYYGDGDPPRDHVPAPPNSNENTVAVEIRGSSLGSLFDRWLVYYDEVHTPPTTEMLRKLCVVGLPDGRVLVKEIRPGTAKGLYHLVSQTEGIIEDQIIDWAARVTALLPRT